MRHHNRNRKLGRVRKVRVALIRSLARSLVFKESIITTEAKAKALRSYVERLITRGKKNTIAVRRDLKSELGGSGREAKKIVEKLSVSYKERPGGYLRITKLGSHSDDARKKARIEFVK